MCGPVAKTAPEQAQHKRRDGREIPTIAFEDVDIKAPYQQAPPIGVVHVNSKGAQ
jgi:hypothetical protein